MNKWRSLKVTLLMKDIERPTGGIHENSNFTVEEKGFD